MNPQRQKQAFWLLFTVTAVVYFAMVGGTLQVISEAAGGLPALDARAGGYTFDEAKAFLTALSTQGYSLYLDVQLILDAIYPVLYGATLFFAIVWLAPRQWGYWRFVLALVAIPGSVLNYAENIAVGGLIRAGADLITPDMVATASRWTMLKTAAGTVALLVLAVVVVLRLVGRQRPQATEGEPTNPRYGERLRKWTGS